VNKKAHRFQNIYGTVRRNMKRKSSKETELKVYKILAGSASWRGA
jgi:hypothetical protein